MSEMRDAIGISTDNQSAFRQSGFHQLQTLLRALSRFSCRRHRSVRWFVADIDGAGLNTDDVNVIHALFGLSRLDVGRSSMVAFSDLERQVVHSHHLRAERR